MAAKADIEDEDFDKGVYLFGYNLADVRCMRTSLLTGYVGALVSAIAGVWWKNSVSYGMHSGLAGYWIVATFCWVKCRIQSGKQNANMLGAATKRALKMVGGNEYILPPGLVKERAKEK